MKTIFKYELPDEQVFHLDLPGGARILSFQWQPGPEDHLTGESEGGAFVVWAIAEPRVPVADRYKCFLALTGDELPAGVEDDEYKYVGTARDRDGTVLHLFMEKTGGDGE